MKTNRTLQRLLSECQKIGEIPHSLLDDILDLPQSLDRNLATILRAVEGLLIVDDRTTGRNVDDDEKSPIESRSSVLQRYVAKSRILTKPEEVHLAKRIEFTRRRLERAICRSNASEETREYYFDLIETPETDRTPAPRKRRQKNSKSDEEQLLDYWNDYLQLRNDLIEVNVPLVERIAGRYRTYGIPHGDLVQHGCLGLIRAADKFDWRRNVRFRTYGEWWIRQAIERATDTDRDVIHVPRPMRQLISKANHLNRRLGSERPLDAARFAELMNVDRGPAARAFSIKSGVASLDRSAMQDGPLLRNELVGHDLSYSAERQTSAHLHCRVDGMVDDLPQREQRIINLRYGLCGENPHTLEEVGVILKISRERVRQLQMRAIKQLKVNWPDPRTAF